MIWITDTQRGSPAMFAGGSERGPFSSSLALRLPLASHELLSLSSNYGWDSSVYCIFILMATWENANGAIKESGLFIGRPPVMAAANAQAPATHTVDSDVKGAFMMHPPNVQKEAVWVWGLTRSGLECFIYLLWASVFTSSKEEVVIIVLSSLRVTGG